MLKSQFRTPGLLGSNPLKDEIDCLRFGCSNVRSAMVAPTGNVTPEELSEQLSRYNWEAVLKNTDTGKQIAELSNKLARRGTAMMAFRLKHIRFFVDEVRKNIAGDLRGITLSKTWRKAFDGLGKFGEILAIAGIPMKAAELSWKDLSTKGIVSNSAVTMGQWSTETVALGPTQLLQLTTQATAWGAGALGFDHARRYIKMFSIELDKTINETKEVIDKAMSVENARDLLTWDRSVLRNTTENIGQIFSRDNVHDALAWKSSVVNPDNWASLKQATQTFFDGVATELHTLHQRILDRL